MDNVVPLLNLMHFHSFRDQMVNAVKSIVIFEVENTSSVDVDSKKKDLSSW